MKIKHFKWLNTLCFIVDLLCTDQLVFSALTVGKSQYDVREGDRDFSRSFHGNEKGVFSLEFLSKAMDVSESENSLQSEKVRRIVDRLRAIGLSKYIELPQVAVMGDTSNGKSSVLSAISGIAFPSNDKLTTRCPTQVILSQAESFSGHVYLQRYNNSSEREDFENISEIKQVGPIIQKITQKLIDEGQYISDDSIVIDLRGPDLPNLTVTDLPGLVRAVADGEDESIITRVRDLVDRFLKQKRTVILAVVPANVDMHNTEILQAAGKADPTGERTISIITKIDRVERGTEDAVINLLLNKKKKLKLGYHAVICRAQQAVSKGVTIAEGIENERRFFKTETEW